MDATVGTLLGVVVGALIGGGGKYFGGRRDAWMQARAHGLMLLADVRVAQLDPVQPNVALARQGWSDHHQQLATFRRGLYPSGLNAPQWSALAAAFAAISPENPAQTQEKLRIAEALLAQFENDPHIFAFVITAPFRNFQSQVSSRRGARG